MKVIPDVRVTHHKYQKQSMTSTEHVTSLYTTVVIENEATHSDLARGH